MDIWGLKGLKGLYHEDIAVLGKDIRQLKQGRF